MRALLLRKGKKELDRREGREEEGICRTNVKVLPTPLIQDLARGGMASACSVNLQRRSGAEPSAWSRPLVRSNFSFWMFNGSRKFPHFSKIRKRKNHKYSCCFCKNKPQCVTD